MAEELVHFAQAEEMGMVGVGPLPGPTTCTKLTLLIACSDWA
jgi:hypothetical protein